MTPDGKIAMDYAKIHPFSYGEEHAHFRGGEKICTGKLGEFQVGLAICYDLRFPEQFRTMVPEAEILLCLQTGRRHVRRIGRHYLRHEPSRISAMWQG